MNCAAELLPLPLRLLPGDELRGALTAALAAQGASAGFVLAGIGSLAVAQIRLAGAAGPIEIAGPLEILSLCGSLSQDGPHLHLSVADAAGRVTGGHASPGCIVHTTAELLIVLLPGWQAGRAFDAATGFAEWALQAKNEPSQE